MEFSPRRVVLFVVMTLLVLISWRTFVIPNLVPAPKPAANQNADQADPQPPDEPKPAADAAPTDGPAIAEKPPKPVPGEQKPETFPHNEEIFLGSLAPQSGYFLRIILTTQGAAVVKIELNDPRYRDLDDPSQPLALVQTIDTQVSVFRTFNARFPEVASALARHNLDLQTVDWKVKEQDDSHAVFEYVVPNAFRLQKRYELKKIDANNLPEKEVRDTNAEGYQLHLALSVKNLQDEQAVLHYELQGPVGLPLEDQESTRKFRDVKLGIYRDGKLLHNTLTAEDFVESIDENDVESWTSPFRYVGVDGQFFATLVLPQSGGTSSDQIAKYEPLLVARATEPNLSEISVRLTSQEITLAPGEQFEHQYALFAGPKRQAILDEIDAGPILEFGWFGWISKGMLAVLSFLHNSLLFPYGLAIIGLTMMVRGALYPLSKKQAVSAARMKELQPRLQELKKKYGDDKQKFAQAQMELFRDAGYNPFAGCLPMLLQLPIFIGLYAALNHAVDLRAAPFLWVDNLAAPDALFQFPFRIPYLGRNFNLLPIVTIALFLIQQKMFMPPPAPDDEQAQMQYKMMNVMMFVMGFLFYHVPAGLCVYFIASSLWGMGERKILDFGKKDAKDAPGGIANAASTTQPGGSYFKSDAQAGRGKGANVASKKRDKKKFKPRR